MTKNSITLFTNIKGGSILGQSTVHQITISLCGTAILNISAASREEANQLVSNTVTIDEIAAQASLKAVLSPSLEDLQGVTIAAQSLDELVHTAAEALATKLNNGGVDLQLAFLAQQGYTALTIKQAVASQSN